MIDPFGSMTFMSPLVRASFNTMTASALSQSVNGDFNLGVMLTAGAMRFGFGVATGGISPDSLGSAWSVGMGNGFFSSTARATGGW